jgi:putative transposase
MSRICVWFGISRQAHYQMIVRRQQGVEQEQQIVDLVRGLRQRHPRMGARKVLHHLQPELAAAGLEIGRDRFFDLLARYDLLLPLPRQKRRTTWAGLWRCPNRLTDLTISQVQQVWVCDITYLETEQGFCYLALITDAFSRYIVGFDVSTSLVVEGALRALQMAIAQATGSLAGLIHHSDHGVQYTCHIYRQHLLETHILSSMGEIGNCYDNPLAERVNGILKLEYRLDDLFVDVAQAVVAVKQAVWLYNHERPHLSLNYLKPVDVHFNALNYFKS